VQSTKSFLTSAMLLHSLHSVQSTLTCETLLNGFLPHMTSDFHQKKLKFLKDLHRVVITFFGRVLTECVYWNNKTFIRVFVENWKKETHTQLHIDTHTMQTKGSSHKPFSFPLQKIAVCEVYFFSAQFRVAHQKIYKH
jgi:hypothetical protein